MDTNITSSLCVKLHLGNGRTDETVSSDGGPSVLSFVSLSVVSVRGVHPTGGGTNRDAS